MGQRYVGGRQRMARPFSCVALAVRWSVCALAWQAAPALAQAHGQVQASGVSAAVLPTVMVTGQAASPAALPYAGGQVSNGLRMGLLGERDFMETPLSTVSYTEGFIAEQSATDVQGVIARNDPSVFLSGIPGEHLESYSIRGFAMDAGDVRVDGLAGMGSSYRNLSERFERIEVLKGPSAMLGGMAPSGSVGGAVNLVPKRAGDAPLTRLTVGMQSDAHGRAHLDVGRWLGAQQQVGIRFNAMGRSGDTAVDGQKKKAHLGALALDWRGAQARVFADLYSTRERVNGMTRGLTLAPGVAVPRPPKATVSWNPPWAFYDTTARGGDAAWRVGCGRAGDGLGRGGPQQERARAFSI